MTITEQLADLEARARASGVSVSQICEAANIAQSNWTRWKQGSTMPTMRLWQRVQQAALDLLEPAQ